MSERDGEIDYTSLLLATGKSVDPWHSFVQLVPFLVNEARQEANENARSYRDFRVGAAVLSVSSSKPRQSILYGANTKPTPESQKVCAEKRIFRRGYKRGFDWPVGLVVTGERNEDHGSGLNPPTLHPCDECRDLIGRYAEDDTLILTVGLNKDRYQLFTAGELLSIHDNPDDPANKARSEQYFDDPDFKGWEVSRNLYGLLINGFVPEAMNRQANSITEAARIAITGVFPED